MSNAQISC